MNGLDGIEYWSNPVQRWAREIRSAMTGGAPLLYAQMTALQAFK